MNANKIQEMLDEVLAQDGAADMQKFGQQMVEVLPEFLNQVGVMQKRIDIADQMAVAFTTLALGGAIGSDELMEKGMDMLKDHTLEYARLAVME